MLLHLDYSHILEENYSVTRHHRASTSIIVTCMANRTVTTPLALWLSLALLNELTITSAVCVMCRGVVDHRL
jgi:hypothetical protein